MLIIDFQRPPDTATEFKKEPSIVEKISPQNFWDTEHERSVGNGLDNILAKPFPEFHHPLLMTGWAKFCWKKGLFP